LARRYARRWNAYFCGARCFASYFGMRSVRATHRWGRLFHILGRLLVWALLGIGISAAAGRQALSLISMARAEPPPRAIQFDISAQPLPEALNAYGAASGTQVLYESALTAQRTSHEVRGVYTPEAALQLLLSGTDLDFEYTMDRAITLTPNATMRGVDPQRGYDRFLGGVQAGVMNALCGDPATRPGPFRVAVQFWINAAGATISPALLHSSGTPSRDRAIIGRLSRLSFSEPPPAAMPQPITLVLAEASAAGRGNGCDQADRIPARAAAVPQANGK
jgi:hypothetical protein